MTDRDLAGIASQLVDDIRYYFGLVCGRRDRAKIRALILEDLRMVYATGLAEKGKTKRVA